MKIKTIKLQNFKAISEMEADFNGCSAIITGGNNKGKTSFLRGLIDRIRFVRPDVMLKAGEKEGRGEMILTNGDKFVWEFDNSRDKLTLITAESRQSVTKELGSQFFPPVFDIDKFLQSTPKQQVLQLQKIVGLDFTDIDQRYQKAYDIRTERNREAEIYRVKLEKMLKCDRVDPVDLTELKSKRDAEKARLNALYLDNKKANELKRKEFFDLKSVHDKNTAEYEECKSAANTLKQYGYIGNLSKFLEEKKLIIPELIEPTYIEELPDRSKLDKIEEELLRASEVNAEAQKYQEYLRHARDTEAAKDAAHQADIEVKKIEEERKQMIASVKMPDGIDITPGGITVDGFPLDRNQISTSKLYTSALKIASINIGEVRTLYFDASFLDRNTLAEIQKWANENDLQLLIERPDYDGGDIKYEIIEA